MKKTLTRKAFTIVELVIVIAVIAILAAVLIPTFSSLIQKSKVSADQQLIRNLNSALKADVKTHATMTDALQTASEFGYDVSKINASATGNEILWDSKNDIFCYLDGSTVKYIPDGNKTVDAADVDLWIIAKTPSNKYSTYLYKTELTVINDLATGLDVGNETITAITYKGSSSANYTGNPAGQSVVIRTTGGTLTVDAAKDTVDHYADLDSLSVDRIAGESYHEHGKVKVSAVIKDGHFVVEENGFVNELTIPVVASGSAVSVNILNGGAVNTAVIDDSSAELAISSGSAVGQIVGDTAHVTGEGATGAKENAIEKTLVGTADELKTALQESKKYIVFTADITANKLSNDDDVVACITSDVILDGAGYTLTANAGRAIWVDNSNVTATIKNLKIVGSNSCQRGIQVNGSKVGVSLIIDNIELTNISYYAINVCNGAGVDIVITNSKISGWGALNLWSADYKVYVANSELTGHNNKSYNAEGWNDFGTVVLEGDTTKQTTEHSSTIDVEIVNTKITASTSGQGNKQYCILFNEGCTSNNVKLTGCTIVYNNGENTFLVCDDGEGNNLYIDGAKVSE